MSTEELWIPILWGYKESVVWKVSKYRKQTNPLTVFLFSAWFIEFFLKKSSLELRTAFWGDRSSAHRCSGTFWGLRFSGKRQKNGLHRLLVGFVRCEVKEVDDLLLLRLRPFKVCAVIWRWIMLPWSELISAGTIWDSAMAPLESLELAGLHWKK